MTRIRMIFAAALATAVVSLAQAGSPTEMQLSKTVQYADLNLSNPKGAERLYWRLQAAAKVVCEPLNDRNLRRHVKYEACLKEAVTAAVVDINQPLLTQLHRSRDNAIAQDSIARLD